MNRIDGGETTQEAIEDANGTLDYIMEKLQRGATGMKAITDMDYDNSVAVEHGQQLPEGPFGGGIKCPKAEKLAKLHADPGQFNSKELHEYSMKEVKSLLRLHKLRLGGSK